MSVINKGYLLLLVAAAAGILPAATFAQPLPLPAASSTAMDDYKLGVGDRVRVIVYNEETLTGEFQVAANGKISFPLIGDIDATAQTPPELAAIIQSRLADGYLRDPHVSMEVVAYRPFFILGEVKNPAQYPYVNGITVMNAAAMAGGFTPRAARKKAFIRHAGEDKEKAYDLTADLRLQPGDTVRIGERYF